MTYEVEYLPLEFCKQRLKETVASVRYIKENSGTKSLILRLEEELKEAKKAASVSIKERMTHTRPIFVPTGSYGILPPYLLSDILRFSSKFLHWA